VTSKRIPPQNPGSLNQADIAASLRQIPT